MKRAIKAIVTDIEGTTSSISFVKDVLFPYATKHIPAYVRDHHREAPLREILDDVAALAQIPRQDLDALIQQLLNWIAQDKKITPLKSLQGLVWEAGYKTGAYRAHVYPDAVAQLNAWHAQGVPLFVYSSGSVAAQKLFFEFSEAGNLLPLFRGHFDTTVGAKGDTAAYQRIRESIGVPAENLLFLSDVEAELDAAAAAGWHTCWLQRPKDMQPTQGKGDHPIVHSFSEIEAALDA